ncbi:hypothetical protein RRG08_008063 [Elysia crispata]|uniref:Uncharacterized protein n=1 Tax=Elysia crispata TaxID=231223 RepID=A0AAE0Z8H5_9GAST|nr:hypothetical protein RRG08_008063 [Elysia crispata]
MQVTKSKHSSSALLTVYNNVLTDIQTRAKGGRKKTTSKSHRLRGIRFGPAASKDGVLICRQCLEKAEQRHSTEQHSFVQIMVGGDLTEADSRFVSPVDEIKR